MNDTASGDRYLVPALQRGMQLLGQFSRDERELTGAELSRRLDLPRASVFRLLQTLEQMGFVERVGDSASYKLGIAVLRLGFEYLASMELTEHGRPIIDALCGATGLSSHLVVRDGREVVFVAKASGRSLMINSIQVGARLPAHATVLGRVLLGGNTLADLGRMYGEGSAGGLHPADTDHAGRPQGADRRGCPAWLWRQPGRLRIRHLDDCRAGVRRAPAHRGGGQRDHSRAAVRSADPGRHRRAGLRHGRPVVATHQPPAAAAGPAPPTPSGKNPGMTHSKPRITVGELVVRFLENCGTRAAFGVISIHNMPMLDAFHTRVARSVSCRRAARPGPATWPMPMPASPARWAPA